MYKIEKTDYGFKLVFEGFIQSPEMKEWYDYLDAIGSPNSSTPAIAATTITTEAMSTTLKRQLNDPVHSFVLFNTFHLLH